MNQSVENTITSTGSFPAVNLPVAYEATEIKINKKYTVNCHSKNEALTIAPCNFSNISRLGAEQFIGDVFYSAHGAVLKSFLPELFSASRDGKIVAAVGVRFLDKASIFLEQYLASPIETLLSELTSHQVDREYIAEVGNLASLCGGSSRMLIAFLITMFDELGVEWAVCTGTNAVRAVMKRMGVEFELLQRAEAESLGEDRFDWGSYYQNNPYVLAVNIPDSIKVIRSKYKVCGDVDAGII